MRYLAELSVVGLIALVGGGIGGFLVGTLLVMAAQPMPGFTGVDISMYGFGLTIIEWSIYALVLAFVGLFLLHAE